MTEGPSIHGSPQTIPPLIDWMSRHGHKVLFLLVLIELAFHAWAIRDSKRHESERPGNDSRRPGEVGAMPA
jgi:hypothetical protein